MAPTTTTKAPHVRHMDKELEKREDRDRKFHDGVTICAGR